MSPEDLGVKFRELLAGYEREHPPSQHEQPEVEECDQELDLERINRAFDFKMKNDPYYRLVRGLLSH